jgi:aspartate/methionine/tyrosine aminotransferase
VSPVPPPPRAVARLAMPELAPLIGSSLRAAERQLENAVGSSELLDVTYVDTHRFPPPAWALETFNAAASGGGMTYTAYRGDPGVRRAVAENIQATFGLDVDPGRSLILTPGTQGALFTALGALVEEGDTVLLVDPEYLSTERMLRYYGARVVHIPIVWRSPERPTLDFDAIEAALPSRPRLMVFSHPNNPSGAIYSKETLERLAEIAARSDLLLLTDELYCRLVYDGEPFHHLAAIDRMADRTVTLLGPSKAESLSGYRLGVAVAPAEIVDRMEDLQSCTALRAPAYAQHVLTRWLRDDREFMAARIEDYTHLRDATVRHLNASGLFEVQHVYGTAYAFPKLLVDTSDLDVAIAFKQRVGIVVNPGFEFGPAGLGHLRICFGQDEARWAGALADLTSVAGSFLASGMAPRAPAGV